MYIYTNELGYVTSYNLAGDLIGGIEVEEPEDLDQFRENFESYRLEDSILIYDENHSEIVNIQHQQNTIRAKRQKICFSVVNRGQIWYEELTAEQLAELREWYHAWLDATETLVEPETPEWLNQNIASKE